MRRYWRVLPAALTFAAMLGTDGCLVPKSALDAAKAANAQAQHRLEQERERADGLQKDGDNLRRMLEGRDADLAGKDRQLALLTDQLKKANDTIKELQRLIGARPTEPLPGPLPPQVDLALRQLAQANPNLLEYLPEYGMVKLKSDLTFAPGATEIQQPAMQALSKLVAILNSPAAAGLNAYIAGHTDDMPISKPDTLKKHPNNWYLSAHRAVAVEIAMHDSGLADRRMAVLGFSEYHPVAPNARGGKGNRLNRRVEIWITSETPFVTQQMGRAALAPAADGNEAGEK